MKKIKILNIMLFAIMFFAFQDVFAQTDTIPKKADKIYLIRTNDGGEFVGKILTQDPKEVLIDTKDRGLISIPKYQIKEMREIENAEFSVSGEFISKQLFSTRYFITTNGLPIEKGESYIQWNLYGPDFQFGVSKNLGLGIMTSWVGVPIIGSIKYSIPLKESKSSFAVGALLGTGSWTQPDFGIALPFVAYTLGDRKANFTLSCGYGGVFSDGDSEGRFLMSVAFMARASKKISIVFDSFIVAPGGYENNYDYYLGYTRERKKGGALLIPGIRWQTDEDKAFQFGFAGIYADGELAPFPFPMVQWYRKF